MASLYQIIGVFLGLVAPSYSLSCTQCFSPSNSCTGPSVTCPSGSVCGAAYTESWALGILVSRSYIKSCVPQDECDKTGSMTIPSNGRVKLGTSCCGTDLCTPTLPSLPGDSSVSNGLTCRSCISADSTWCYTSDTMQCTGNENMCFLQTTKISGTTSSSIAMRGCATKSICDLGSQSSSVAGLKTEVKFICTNGSTGLQKGFYLPAVICVFFLKLLI
ncbi:phospholipase A2 inhibitor 25 kDa subunit-like [Rana temporaria]|uniref:phospholipase A2 inhibitor 25 kDa subunit-like n=1 Tax=Rana temporaria TaxID=8407 RepID=UPI001AADA6F8|nr:phospholipase A2 inhibitor 25 kDa subunit-like [Rana temporaria]